MGQTDLVAGVRLVSGTRLFISPIYVAWLFIENFVLIAWSLGKEEKSVQLLGMSNSMVKSQYAYRASSLS